MPVVQEIGALTHRDIYGILVRLDDAAFDNLQLRDNSRRKLRHKLINW
jgi:hypothetical protein